VIEPIGIEIVGFCSSACWVRGLGFRGDRGGT
jgi:hypothetical protein